MRHKCFFPRLSFVCSSITRIRLIDKFFHSTMISANNFSDFQGGLLLGETLDDF